MKRRSKTIAQQCRYYEVDNIFEYMVSVYLNGNISAFGELFKELKGQKGIFLLSLFRGRIHSYPRNHFSNHLTI